MFSQAKDVPTLKEWYIILHFKDEINNLLVNNGGEKLKRDSYWSCDVCDNIEAHAFGIFIRDGITFDDRSWSFSDICSAATRDNHKIGMG